MTPEFLPSTAHKNSVGMQHVPRRLAASFADLAISDGMNFAMQPENGGSALWSVYVPTREAERANALMKEAEQ